MELRLIVEPPDGGPQDVAVQFEDATTGRELIDALAQYLHLPRLEGSRSWWGHCRRSGVSIGDETPLSAAALRQGDRLFISIESAAAVPEPAEAPGSVELSVIDGPARGRRVDLAIGEYLVGRASPSDVVIVEDPHMSARHFRVRVTPQGITVADERSRNGTFVGETRIDGDRPVAPGEVVRAGRTTMAFRPVPGPASSTQPSERRTSAPAVELAVTAGPMSGLRAPLAPGRSVVGRDRGADLPMVDDPSLGGRHFAIEVMADGLFVTDLGSKNGTSVDDQRLRPTDRREVRLEQVVRAGRSAFVLKPASEPGATLSATIAGHLTFNRPPRVMRRYTPPTLRLEAPPADAEKARLPLATALVPLLFGALMLVVLRAAGADLGGPALLMPVMFMAMSPVMAVLSFMQTRRGGSQQARERAKRFEALLAAFGGQLAAAHEAEIVARNSAAPDAAEVVSRATDHAPTLWERRPGDDDFLALRVGLADQPSQVAVQFEPGGSESLRARAQAIISRYATAAAVPVIVSLPKAGVLGLSGTPDHVDRMGRALAVQIATAHSPQDAILAAAISPARLAGWEWLKWLPHTRSETSPLGGTHLASDPGHVEALVAEAERVLRERRRAAEPSVGTGAPGPVVVLFVDESVASARARFVELLAGGPRYGLLVVWLGSDPRDLPGECRTVIESDPAIARLEVVDTEAGTRLRDVTADGVPVEVALTAALALAPLRDAAASKPSEGIPGHVSVLDLLGMPTPSREAVARRWAASSAHLGAPIGRTADAVLDIDLRRDGAHGLVVGTTGSGKSEMLQSFITALAATHPPNRLTFLLIDGKGGAAFKDCAALPHTVGYVTELDPHIARRALISLEAELAYRETVITQQHGARDLGELQRTDPDAAPPSLLVVIDEFGALAGQMPEFTERIVEIGQKGRSLGMHFILATQSSAGVVTGHIRANTNLRIALRTLNASESQDVIETSDAASIPRSLPGRALVMSGRDPTGRAEVTEFQAAYGGGSTTWTAEGAGTAVGGLLFGGVVWPKRRASVAPGARLTDLQRLIAVVAEAAEASTIPGQRRPWLPLLPAVVPLSSLAGETGSSDTTAAADVGLLDDPARQSQRRFTIDLETDGDVLVYGTGGSGKTTLLRTIGVSLALRGSPSDVQLYGLDSTTGALKGLEALPHCGSVVLGEDQQSVEHLFRLLAKTIARRKEAFARAGAASLAEYRARSSTHDPVLPRVVVLLDGYAGFVSAYERVNLAELIDLLPRLVADGRSLGVHFVITAERRGAVPNALAGLITRRIILAMADDDEYRAFDLRPEVFKGASLPAGRGFVTEAGTVLEVQCAIPGDDPSGGGQAQAIQTLGRQLGERYPGVTVPAVRLLPLDLPRSLLPVSSDPLHPILGLGDEELQPVSVDLTNGHFLVAGPYRSGRTTALATLALSLRDALPAPELHLLAPRSSAITGLQVWASVASGTDACNEAAGRLVDLVQGRAAAEWGPAVIVVDDGDELLEGPGAAFLETLVRRGRDAPLHVVAAVETGTVHRAYSGWLRELRKDKQGLLLAPEPDVDGDLLAVRLPRRTNASFPPGRGYLVQRGIIELVQVARG